MENELKPASRSRASKPSQVSSTRATNSSPLSISPSPVLSPHSAPSRPVRLTPSVNCASISSPFYPSYLYSAVTLEAASARMAARDRFGAYAEPGLTPLQRAIRTSPLFLSLPKATRTRTHTAIQICFILGWLNILRLIQVMPATCRTTNPTSP